MILTSFGSHIGDRVLQGAQSIENKVAESTHMAMYLKSNKTNNKIHIYIDNIKGNILSQLRKIQCSSSTQTDPKLYFRFVMKNMFFLAKLTIQCNYISFPESHFLLENNSE